MERSFAKMKECISYEHQSYNRVWKWDMTIAVLYWVYIICQAHFLRQFT